MTENGHAQAPLGKLLSPVRREVRVASDQEYHLLGARWYAKGLYTKEVKPGSSIKADKLYRVEAGDFVYNRLFAWKGSFAVASPENAGCYVSNEFPCFAVDADHINASYLWFYFQREAAWNAALGLSFGATPTSRNRLKEENLLSMEIPLPPLSEQRRIVAKIERLAGRIDNASSIRVKSHANLRQLIATVTSRLIEELKGTSHEPIARLGRDGANPIQTGPFGAQLHKSEFTLDGVPVLNVGNVWPEGLRLDRLDHVARDKAEQLGRYRVRARDLLFARSGATLGKVCLVPEDCDNWLMTGHLFRVRFDESRCDPMFAFMVLRNAKSVRNQVFEQVRGATRPGFNTTLLGRVELPLPPLPEQRRIVAYLDGLQAKVDQVKRLQAESAAELEALLPAILDRAFKGEL